MKKLTFFLENILLFFFSLVEENSVFVFDTDFLLT